MQQRGRICAYTYSREGVYARMTLYTCNVRVMANAAERAYMRVYVKEGVYARIRETHTLIPVTHICICSREGVLARGVCIHRTHRSRTVRARVLAHSLARARAIAQYVYDDVTYVYDDVTYVYDDVTRACYRLFWLCLPQEIVVQ